MNPLFKFDPFTKFLIENAVETFLLLYIGCSVRLTVLRTGSLVGIPLATDPKSMPPEISLALPTGIST